MDAFYAAVEQRDDPTLRGRPVVVGGAGNRGVVAAASYEARRYGVHSAMPMAQARRRCPDLVVLPHRFDVYRDVSSQVMDVFWSYTPLVEPLSLDEAFLDVAGSTRLFGSPVAIARRIRADVRSVTDLPCSIGVAPTKFVAKLCSAKAKPDGLLHWPAGEVAARLRPLPIGDLWGAGPRTIETLRGYGFTTVGQLADADRHVLARLVGDALGGHLHRLACGEDARLVTPGEAAKSVSAEQTFEHDLTDSGDCRRMILRLSERVGRRLRTAGLSGRTITLKVRLSPFETRTRSSTLPAPTDRTHDLATVAGALFDGLELVLPMPAAAYGRTVGGVRLLGVGVSNLADAGAAGQLTLAASAAPAADARWRALERVADEAAERFGTAGVSYGSLLDGQGLEHSPTRDDR